MAPDAGGGGGVAGGGGVLVGVIGEMTDSWRRGLSAPPPSGGPLQPPDGLIRQEVLLERLTALVSHVSAKRLKCSSAAAGLWHTSLADLDPFYCFEML